MLCDIQADFLSQPFDSHVVDGSIQLSQFDDRPLSDIKVELIGVISYLCPTLNPGNSFMDPERPSYTLKECEFLNLSHSIENTELERKPFRFDLPHLIELNDTTSKNLSLHRTSAVAPRYPLPPSFSEESASYLQTLFVPWKEPSKARVDYMIKVTVASEKKAGMGRLLGGNRGKSFRKHIIIIPSTLGDHGQTLLPRYSGRRSKHWHREPCVTSDGFGAVASVFSNSYAKLSLMGDTTLMRERPLQFCLEINQKNGHSSQSLVNFDLVRIVSTKLRSGKREVERRMNTNLTNLLLVTGSEHQVDDTAIVDRINLASYNTDDRLLNGALCLLDPTTKQGTLAPAFTFAGLTVEVSNNDREKNRRGRR